MPESNAPQTTKPSNLLGNVSEGENGRNSSAFNKSVADGKEKTSLPDPCGKTTLGKISIALDNFFTTLKGIKKYSDTYITPTINAISNITTLINQTSEIIAAVLKILINRLRDFLLDQIRKGIELLIDQLLPTIAKAIKNTIIQTVVDNLFCAFKDIVKNLVNLVGDFLFELVGKIVNAPFCAAEQFANALVNNVAAIVDDAIAPILGKINDLLGGVTKIIGNVFQALDYILGFEAFLCAAPNCPEIKEFQASAWAGPNQSQIDSFDKFIAPISNISAGGIIGEVDDYISDLEIFGSRVGDAEEIPSNITQCNTDAFRCGPPKVEIFGGGGAGAIGRAIVDDVGKTIGVDLISGGSGYTRPPFVSFVDSCGETFTTGYAVIGKPDPDPDPDTGGTGTGTGTGGTGTGTGTGGTGTGTGGPGGEVTEIIITSSTASPPDDGRTEFDDLGDGDGGDRGSDYIVCLEGFRIKNTGIGYTENDSITITPNISNLVAGVKMTEFGQIFDIEIAEPICGLTGLPEIEIESLTGVGADIEPILSFTRIEEFDRETDNVNILNIPVETLRGRTVFTEGEIRRKNVIRVVDCVS